MTAPAPTAFRAWRGARSLRHMAGILGVSQSLVHLWESGDCLPGPDLRASIERLSQGRVPVTSWLPESTVGHLEREGMETRFRAIGIWDAVVGILARYGATPDDLARTGRTPHLAMARGDIALFLSERFCWSTTEIGRALYRDHTTIVHALKGARKRREQLSHAAE